MAGNSSAIVAGLTAAALSTVAFLGHQAASNAPTHPHATRAGASPGAVQADRGTDSADGTHDAGTLIAPPRGSGRGTRVVYALGIDRVWLVEKDDKVKRTFTVTPGTVDPAPGTYRVTSRSGKVTGSDGVPVEHVVRFADNDGTVIGFSAALDGSAPELAPKVRTGGVRETRADGRAMWKFATIGRTVVVVR
ncbi:hypothetical protein JL475_05315 [Streptomyces sp. M2CJ-2]|uniref:hypothetical protein n=1 Tax=Streptomyces sp. M2CJ-2 TaxID=2803948 RepID=UPI001921AD7A|nr:hypothetical protein [Streptomyces sp. M2CJ-2]MBL3665430.1 hypothetical protein [Streptomyces sp. M2CJ-2]